MIIKGCVDQVDLKRAKKGETDDSIIAFVYHPKYLRLFEGYTPVTLIIDDEEQ